MDMANSVRNSLESKPEDSLKGSVPLTLVWSGLLLVIGLVLTLFGVMQDRSEFLQIGLVIAGCSAFVLVARITVWGSR